MNISIFLTIFTDIYKSLMSKVAEKPAEIKIITPLRGVGALCVVVYHFNIASTLQGHDLLTGIWAPYFEKIQLWVDFFFILSGFILCHVYGNTFTDNVKKEKYTSFIVARFARIYPLHLFTLFLLVVPNVLIFFVNRKMAFNAEYSLPSLVANVFLLNAHGLFDRVTWNMPSWSIGAEWYTYMFAPFLFVFIKYTSSYLKHIFLFLFMIAGLMMIIHFNPEHNLDAPYNFGFVKCFIEFMVGVSLYRIFMMKGYGRYFEKDWVFILSGIALFYCIYYIKNDIPTVIAICPLIIASSNNKGFVSKIFSHKIFEWLGNVSYSIYLMHAPIIFYIVLCLFIFGGPTYLSNLSANGWAMYMWLSVALTLILSHFSYKYLELKWNNKIKNFYYNRKNKSKLSN